ncbi:MAG TPA: UDP-glucose 4-epimerase GalE [Acidimicrobiales bacterium]
MSSTVLVTGGAGYIGSHTCLELLGAGHRVVVVDNLSNSSPAAIERVRELAGPGAPELVFVEADLRDTAVLERVVGGAGASSVVHFAGKKAVGESVAQPLDYYDNNFVGTLNLLRAMEGAGVRRLVFSSSCTVYGEPSELPLTEAASRWAFSPYGRTKLFVEEMIQDLVTAQPEAGWRVMLLRYFNPVGAHPSGRIGEDPEGIPNNLMPFVMQVSVGLRDAVRVFGDDYDTVDGTGVRDYVHVMDLAAGHLAALSALERNAGPSSSGACTAVNLGTGLGHSVLEVIAAASRAVGRDVPYRVTARRPGDVACVYADPRLAADLLGWRATRSLDDMCRDHWAWQRANPSGYRVDAGR